MRHQWDNCRCNICIYTTWRTCFVYVMDKETFGFCIRKMRLEVCVSIILNFCLLSFFLSSPLGQRKDAGDKRLDKTQRAGADILWHHSWQKRAHRGARWVGREGALGKWLCFNFSLFFIAFCSVNLLERNTISQFWWWFAIIPAITTVTSEWQVPVLYRVSFPPPSYCQPVFRSTPFLASLSSSPVLILSAGNL